MIDETFERWRDEWFQLKRQGKKDAADDLLFERLLPARCERLSERHRDLTNRKYHTLVSLMGFSPEITVMTATVFRPERLLIVYSENANADFDRCYRFLDADNVLNPHQIWQVEVEPFGETSIYEAVRSNVARLQAIRSGFRRNGRYFHHERGFHAASLGNWCQRVS